MQKLDVGWRKAGCLKVSKAGYAFKPCRNPTFLVPYCCLRGQVWSFCCGMQASQNRGHAANSCMHPCSDLDQACEER